MIKAEELGVSEDELKKITAEVMNHSNNPKNYGQMENPSSTGKCVNEFNGEFVIVYLKVEDETLVDISFVSNGCKDMVVAGSLFTEMVKGDSLSNAKEVKSSLELQLINAPQTQKDAGTLVLKAFDASLTHLEQKVDEMFTVKINEKDS